jgi:hypothetical protein
LCVARVAHTLQVHGSAILSFLVTGSLKYAELGVTFIGITVIPEFMKLLGRVGHAEHGYVIKPTKEILLIKRIRWTNRVVVYDKALLRYEK